MVDVVRELFLDADLLLFLVQGQGVFAIAVGRRLLQSGVEPDDVVRDFAQFIVGKDSGSSIRSPRSARWAKSFSREMLCPSRRVAKYPAMLISSVTPSMNQRNTRSAARTVLSGTE